MSDSSCSVSVDNQLNVIKSFRQMDPDVVSEGLSLMLLVNVLSSFCLVPKLSMYTLRTSV